MQHEQLIEAGSLEEVAAAAQAAQALLNVKLEEERVLAEQHTEVAFEVKRAKFSLAILTRRLQDLRHVGAGKCAWVTHVGDARHGVSRTYCGRDADGEHGCCSTHAFFADRVRAQQASTSNVRPLVSPSNRT